MSTVRIQVRRGTAAQWAAISPILAAGEMGLESDTNYIKFGDGETVWNDLPYAGDNLAQLQSSLDNTYVSISDIGQPNGVAGLNSSGKVPASQLDLNELSQDVVADMILEGSNISVSYDDAAGKLTFAVNTTPTFTTVTATTANLTDINSTGTSQVNDLNVTGDLVVSGTTTTVNTESFSVSDPLIYIGDDNQSNVLDLGLITSFNDGTYQHAGLVRDASDSTWKLFSGVVAEPTTTVDFTTYTKEDLEVGALIANGAKIGQVLNTEIQKLTGVTSNIQDQIDAKAPVNDPTFTGNVTLPNGAINEAELADGAATTAKIADAAVTVAKLADNAVVGVKIADNAISQRHLSDDSVGTPEIGGLAVTTEKINNAAITTAKIANAAVETEQVADSAITADKIANSVIADIHISSTAEIDPLKIAGTAVTRTDTATVTNEMLAGGIEIAKVDGLQTAIDARAPKADPTFTGNVALPSTTSIGDVSATEIGYVNGVTSAIQDQIDAKAPKDSPSFTNNAAFAGQVRISSTGSYVFSDGSATSPSSGSVLLARKSDGSGLKYEALGVASDIASESYVDSTVSSSISTHNSDTTSIHGIADTSKLVTTDATSQTISGAITITGNLTVQGTTTTVSATDLEVTDPIIYMGVGNSGNTVDLGFAGHFNDGTYQHTGLVRDASDSKWKFFKGVADEPSTTINFAQGSLDDLAVNNLTAAGVVFTDGTQTKAGVPSITNIPTAEASSFTLGANRADQFIPLNGAVTVTLPSSGYVKGQSIDFWQETSTGAQFAGTGVVGTPGLKLRTTNSVATAMKTASGWLVFGDLSA